HTHTHTHTHFPLNERYIVQRLQTRSTYGVVSTVLFTQFDSNKNIKTHKHIQKEGERQTDRETDIERERERDRQTDRVRERATTPHLRHITHPHTVFVTFQMFQIGLWEHRWIETR